MVSNVVARRCAMFFFALSVCVAGARHITEAHAAGAFAVGKCGAYGQAFDYGAEQEARRRGAEAVQGRVHDGDDEARLCGDCRSICPILAAPTAMP